MIGYSATTGDTEPKISMFIFEWISFFLNKLDKLEELLN